MGAWGAGSFENDDAGDWVYDLEKAKSWAIVEEAFAMILAEDVEYIEAPDCSIALAAAEVVAAARGKPAGDLPPDVLMWVAQAPPIHHELAPIACQAVKAILGNSELRELWEESDDFEGWQASLRQLLSRLAD